MKVKTNELSGAALNWAVAEIEAERKLFTIYPQYITPFSTDWSQGGPIIEREWIEVVPFPNESDEDMRWKATQHDLPMRVSMTGPTPLIAAMRCYVASKLGDEVELPTELNCI